MISGKRKGQKNRKCNKCSKFQKEKSKARDRYSYLTGKKKKSKINKYLQRFKRACGC